MARHALGRPTVTTPPALRRRRAVSAVLAGAAALGAVALVPGVAAAAPVPVAPTTTPAKADLAVTVDGSTAIPANGVAEIDVTVTNHGPVAADRVRTTVALTPGVIIIDADGPYNQQTAGGSTVRFDEPEALGSNESRTYSVLVASNRARPSSATVSAGTQSRTLDPALRNNQATGTVTAGGGFPD